MQRGFTFIELLVVIFILSIIASVAVPGLSNADTYHLDLAANEVATALRFARDESIRTAETHGVGFDRNTMRLFVFKAAEGDDPLAGSSLLFHPKNKNIYDLILDDDPLTKGVISLNPSKPFSYRDLVSRQDHVLFDQQGIPQWINSSGTYLLEEAVIQLSYGSDIKTVRLLWGYGRVIIE